MIHPLQLNLSPQLAYDEAALREYIAQYLAVDSPRIAGIKLLKRSIDARKRPIKVVVQLEAYVDEPLPEHAFRFDYPDVSRAEEVIIIGSGPAGLFAALRLIELGFKPVILERGKDVQSRRRDLAALNKEHIVHPDSNYCFGEGGAGTYSDGKLYTRSTKRGDVRRILETFVAHGADENILTESHPHIGTNKLPKIITTIRESILKAGGEVHFETRVTDFEIKDGRIKSVIALQKGETVNFEAKQVLLATGHSARDIFEMLDRHKILIEAKPFALGVRVEHPQELIDSMQYHCSRKEAAEQREYLPAASYSLVQQIEGTGVYSFCMCPGGIIAPCATGPEEVVTNGWSPSKRNNPYANSGIVVAIDPTKMRRYQPYGVFSGMQFQKEMERIAWEAGGRTQTAPAQALDDFVKGKLSVSLPDCSYQPGVKSAALHELLPPFIARRLQEGLKAFGKKMRGYITNEALIVATESRSSSPIRIPRDPEKLHHVQIENLYPSAEGAGYAGGIVSAAIDGQRCAEAIAVVKKSS
ncbi:MAG: FAD-dependent dehydrogenase [Bacteroidetes bacterium]|nr:MAG: FAD-dependent dehydrogenase [Bacteroidota bacterium]